MLAHGRVPIRSRATAFIGALRSSPWTAPPAPTASANDATRKPGPEPTSSTRSPGCAASSARTSARCCTTSGVEYRRWMWRAPFSSNWSIDMSDLLPGAVRRSWRDKARTRWFPRDTDSAIVAESRHDPDEVRPTSGAREDDESLGRSGHRDITVDRSFDARAERLWVDQDDQVELEPLRQLRGQRPDAGRPPER